MKEQTQNTLWYVALQIIAHEIVCTITNS